MPPGTARFKDGAQPLNLAADQARKLLDGGVSQIRLRPGAMADRIEAGSLVWLREPFALPAFADRYAPTDWLNIRAGVKSPLREAVHFLAEGTKPPEFGITRFARTLPRSLSRGFLRVTDVENAQLQRWTAADEVALGMTRDDYIAAWSATARAVASFGGDPSGLRWADNPRVRIITFRLVRQNIDAWLGSQREGLAQPKLAAAGPETAAASSAHPDRPVRGSAPSETLPGHERT